MKYFRQNKPKLSEIPPIWNFFKFLHYRDRKKLKKFRKNPRGWKYYYFVLKIISKINGSFWAQKNNFSTHVDFFFEFFEFFSYLDNVKNSKKFEVAGILLNWGLFCSEYFTDFFSDNFSGISGITYAKTIIFNKILISSLLEYGNIPQTIYILNFYLFLFIIFPWLFSRC